MEGGREARGFCAMMIQEQIMQSLEEKTKALEEGIKKYILYMGRADQPRIIITDALEPLVIDFKRNILFAEKVEGLKQLVPQYKERIRHAGLEVIYA